MRYINLHGFCPTAEWLARAQALTNELEGLTSEERSKFIDDHAEIWTELKKELMERTHNKCWYTETKNPASLYHIDHFRPKKKVICLRKNEPIVKTTNCKESYWWLAFDWENFRVSASIPNTAKGCYFPLRINTDIASNKAELANEFPALLDPKDEDDVNYLDFNEAGRACPSIAVGEDTWEAQRVNISIRVYNLNYPTLVDDRIQLFNRCKTLINDIIVIYEDITHNDNLHARERYKEKNRELRKMVNEESEYSATVISYLLKSEHTFIQKIACK